MVKVMVAGGFVYSEFMFRLMVRMRMVGEYKDSCSALMLSAG